MRACVRACVCVFKVLLVLNKHNKDLENTIPDIPALLNIARVCLEILLQGFSPHVLNRLCFDGTRMSFMRCYGS